MKTQGAVSLWKKIICYNLYSILLQIIYLCLVKVKWCGVFLHFFIDNTTVMSCSELERSLLHEPYTNFYSPLHLKWLWKYLRKLQDFESCF